MAILSGILREALSTQPKIIKSAERCSVDPRALAALGVAVGQQVRLSVGADFALFTIVEAIAEASAEIVRIGPEGIARLGISLTPKTSVSLDTSVVRSGVTLADAQATSDCVEVLADDGVSRFLIAIAPHGGNIESKTDEQASRLYERLAPRAVSSWICRGYKSGGGAFSRWHITSTDLHEASFPGLARVIGRGFNHAVAFHGYSLPDVLIGGSAPLNWKMKLKDAIDAALAGSGIPTRLADGTGTYNGDSPKNIVNRLAPTGGVQIEQPLAARAGYALAIADAVADTYLAEIGLQPLPLDEPIEIEHKHRPAGRPAPRRRR